MAQDDSGERTEEPTAKRLQESREKGQIPRSRELNTLMVLIASVLGLHLLGAGIVEEISSIFRATLHISREEIFDSRAPLVMLKQVLTDALLMLVPFFALIAIVAIFSAIMLGGWSFSVKSLAFKASKMDPIKGVGRMFGVKGLMELVKALAKFFLIATVAGLLLWNQLEEFLQLGMQTVEVGMAHFVDILFWVMLILVLSLVVVAALDVPFQLWDHKRQLKMSMQEIKDETKQAEGSPEMKGRIRQMQMEAAQQRMMQDVPTADVVITNPDHYAVALSYNQNESGAPKVVASGVDLVALQIRAIAKEHDVAIVEAPPLARAIYHSAEIGAEIPAGLYVSVAKILAYVYQVDLYQKQQGGKPSSLKESDLPIPDDLRRD
ncbi:MAG: flagellar biosynthesis protein FlhB [Gammaproteobacteria bacterium]|nr:flagellar biosynthesis protein FlhB [Gammaproteobacteria bacterium]MCF6229485.1 flagellar biosynthesis protein FlhB [Gammaproteobacteria bacterium]